MRENRGIDEILLKIAPYINNSKASVSETNLKYIYKAAQIFFTDKNDLSNKEVVLPEKMRFKAKSNKIRSVLKILCVLAAIGLAGIGVLAFGAAIVSGIAIDAIIFACMGGTMLYNSLSAFSGYEMYKSEEVRDIVTCLNSNTPIFDCLMAADNKHKIYEGYFIGLKYEGAGQINYPDNKKFISSMFKKGSLNGNCEIFHPNGQKYLMEQLNHKIHLVHKVGLQLMEHFIAQMI